MGKDWDAPWKTGAGMSKPGIGERDREWPSFGSNSRFGSANPTCGICGGRLRGANKCECDEPDWHVQGKLVAEGLSEILKQRQAFQAWCRLWLAETYRILPSGGVIKVFGGTRMFHRMAQAMQQVGFEDIGLEAWVYGSEFPKSLNISKAIDKLAGVKPTKIIKNETGSLGGFGDAGWNKTPRQLVYDGPQTEEAKRFEGWGTALKPAWEPFIVGHKPAEKVAE